MSLIMAQPQVKALWTVSEDRRRWVGQANRAGAKDARAGLNGSSRTPEEMALDALINGWAFAETEPLPTDDEADDAVAFWLTAPFATHQ